MYEKLFPYVRSLLLKFIKNKIYLTPETVSDVTKDVCLLILDKYRCKPDFKIDVSFAGYIKYKIMEVLYNPQKVWEEQCGSLNAVLGDEEKTKKTSEVGELPEALKFSYLFPVLSACPEQQFFKADVSETLRAVWAVFVDILYIKGAGYENIRKIVVTGLAILLYFKKFHSAIPRLKENLFKKSEASEDTYDLTLLEIFNRLNAYRY
jgi:hypothetical protein